MGDRCYMEVKCFHKDKEQFEELGFTLQDEATSPDDWVSLVDEEADQAHCVSLPTDCIWIGSSGAGHDYPESRYVCDAVTLRQIDCASFWRPVVQWDYHTMKPLQRSVDGVNRFYAMYRLVAPLLGMELPQGD